jgi:hypothetical protein
MFLVICVKRVTNGNKAEVGNNGTEEQRRRLEVITIIYT